MKCVYHQSIIYLYVLSPCYNATASAQDKTYCHLFWLQVYRDEEENEKCARAIVRYSTGTCHRLVYESQVGDSFSPIKIAKFVVPELSVEQFYPVVCPQSSDLVRQGP